MPSEESAVIYCDLHDASVPPMAPCEQREGARRPCEQCHRPRQNLSSRRAGQRPSGGVPQPSRCLLPHCSAPARNLTRHQPATASHSLLLLLMLQCCCALISCIDSFNDLEPTQTALCVRGSSSKDDWRSEVALGMESGAIPDTALSASSSYNDQSVGPQNARLNRELNGGAWCPANQIDEKNSGKEWIQVNFSTPYVITKVATQGRFGNGMGVEYAEQFWLHYTRDGVNWMQWRNQLTEFEIQGNVDTYSIVESVLSTPLVGVTAIRLLPISKHMRVCCLRFEVFGCPYKDGPISYSMIDGLYSGRFGDLVDDTYDGSRNEDGLLMGGLGQLVDGLKGDDNYKLNKGFEWIGWRASHGTQVPLSITFEFSHVRNFTMATFHCNNMFTKEMQVFHSAKIWFGLEGKNGVQWAPGPESFAYMPDTVVEKARDVVIHLHHRVGQFIKFDLRFAARWLLISEVRFDSRPVARGMILQPHDYVIDPITTPAIASQSPILREPIVLIIFAVVGFLLVVFVLFFFFLARKRKEKMSGSQYTTVPMKDVSTPLYCEPHDFHRLSPFSANVLDPEYAVPDVTINAMKAVPNNITINSPRTFRPTPNAFAFLVNNQQQQQQKSAGYYASTDVLSRSNLASFEQNEPCNGLYGVENHLLGSNKINPMVSHSPPPLQSAPQIPHSSLTPPSSLSSNSSRLLKTSAPNSDLCIYDNTQIHSSSTKTPSPHEVTQSTQIPVLKDTEISVVDGHFGYSKFGDCELGYLVRKNEKKLVILKTLSNEQFRDEFLEEMTEKWRLSSSCTNFARLYGYVSKHDYFAMVIEYGDMDLKKFLRNSSPSSVRFDTLIEIASQVAEAIQELHAKGFIHRDVAARNCLVCTSHSCLKVKITDSGAFIADYKNEYYNEVLPVRWMSYESILQGIFTTKSDVFSFGVTLWELMSYSKTLPHEHLTEEEILSEIINESKSELDIGNPASNQSTFYNHPFNDSAHEYALLKSLQLPQPKECPNDIYDLILECTQRNEDSRPAISEIFYFLHKRCLNFRKI